MASTARILYLLVAFSLVFKCLVHAFSSPETPSITLQVCQHKNCRKRCKASSPLVDTLGHLLTTTQPGDHSQKPPLVVKSTGCLSQCDKGPNIQVSLQSNKKGSDKEVLLFGNTDATIALTQLEALLSSQEIELEVPSKLVAATKVLDKGQKAYSLADKEKFYSSVIKALNADESLSASLTNIHAYLLRAEARVEASGVSGATTVDGTILSDLAVGEQSSHSQNALLDVEQALERLEPLVKGGKRSDKSAQTIILELKARAHRVAADANEAMGRFPQAMADLQQWADCKQDPSYRAKAVKEIQRIQEREGKSPVRM